jgi:outer membrane biosynthesis protein TonB
MPVVDTRTVVDGPVSEFELIIDRAGRVERVRLTSAVNQLQDKMLLAAAKAWLFQPAVRDGQPVRYQLRLRVSR